MGSRLDTTINLLSDDILTAFRGSPTLVASAAVGPLFLPSTRWVCKWCTTLGSPL